MRITKLWQHNPRLIDTCTPLAYGVHV